MLITRYAKIVMAASLAAFCLLVAFDNITDYGTNYLFVQHVMSMDTTFAGNAMMYRAVVGPALRHLAYGLIIAAEIVTGILFLAGAIRLFQVRHASAAIFNQSKIYVIAACLLAFLVWFLGFMVIAGEWFAMWQSATWNGQESAFRFYVTVLVVLIFVNQPDSDLIALKPELAQDNRKPAQAKKRTASKRPPTRRAIDKGRRRTDTE